VICDDGTVRSLRPLLLALVLACVGLVLTQAPASAACRCGDVTVKQAAERADVVFSGVLVGRDDARRRTEYTFDVGLLYRGRLTGTPVEMVSPTTRCSLGKLRVDRSYVVFAQERGTELRSDRCAGTARVTPAYVDRVERVLGPGTAFPEPREEKPPQAEFTRVDDSEPTEFTRLAAPGAALVLAGLLGLFVFRRRR
jgi:hypothetical protein